MLSCQTLQGVAFDGGNAPRHSFTGLCLGHVYLTCPHVISHVLPELGYTRLSQSESRRNRLWSPFVWESLPFRPPAHAFRPKVPGSRRLLSIRHGISLPELSVSRMHLTSPLVISNVLHEPGYTRRRKSALHPHRLCLRVCETSFRFGLAYIRSGQTSQGVAVSWGGSRLGILSQTGVCHARI